MTKSKKTKPFLTNPHLAAGLVKPFAVGARLQVRRLLSAQQTLEHDPITAVSECYHETSNLFEDLATVVHYLNACGVEGAQDQLFRDVRDHIRHDIREEFDNNEKRKEGRAERLKMNSKLQSQISFDVGLIRVGAIEIKLVDITSYLNLADMAISSLLLGMRLENTHTSTTAAAPSPEKEEKK